MKWSSPNRVYLPDALLRDLKEQRYQKNIDILGVTGCVEDGETNFQSMAEEVTLETERSNWRGGSYLRESQMKNFRM